MITEEAKLNWAMTGVHGRIWSFLKWYCLPDPVLAPLASKWLQLGLEYTFMVMKCLPQFRMPTRNWIYFDTITDSWCWSLWSVPEGVNLSGYPHDWIMTGSDPGVYDKDGEKVLENNGKILVPPKELIVEENDVTDIEVFVALEKQEAGILSALMEDPDVINEHTQVLCNKLKFVFDEHLGRLNTAWEGVPPGVPLGMGGPATKEEIMMEIMKLLGKL